ncbi:thiamine pyrophosphate-dependent enzyme [Salinisphaera sp.]|uniref:thiamine pyrophosphate-dependent enzyme n=1 Tax=Salinisphaera sp. TaxID=1914330 RepID=UPI00345CDA06
MGYAVPAALGAQIARPQRRALILVGDGAFQMTGTELVSHCRQGLAPIVIVFNNRGYSTERFILDGPFNDIPEWQFHRLGELFGPLDGYDAPSECAFEEALTAAVADTETASIINVRLEPRDASPAMQRLGAHLKSRLGRDDDA